MKNNPGQTFRNKKNQSTIWGFLAPDTASCRNLGPGKKIIQNGALAATFWRHFPFFPFFGHVPAAKFFSFEPRADPCI